MKRLGRPYEQAHTTRMVPKRAPEILAGGSLYWVIKGRSRRARRSRTSVPSGCGGDRALPSRPQAASGVRRVPPLPPVPGLALSRGEGCAIRPVAPKAAAGIADMPEAMRRETRPAWAAVIRAGASSSADDSARVLVLGTRRDERRQAHSAQDARPKRTARRRRIPPT